MTNSITNNNAVNSANLPESQNLHERSQKRASGVANEKNPTFKGDQVNISYSSETTETYTASMSLEGTHNDGFDLLRGLVLNIFEKQGIDYKLKVDDSAKTSEIDLSTITQTEAEELVADDGYFGVESTSERIFNFAVGIAGNDPSRLDAIKEGVQQGFNEALDAFGGWLPDISYETFDTVMNKLDEWAESS